MDLTRILRHLCTPDWMVRRAFPAATMARIEAAIAASERAHRGELRFAVEAGLDLLPLLRGITPRMRARELFSLLEVWDTELDSGVLVYVQLVDHRIEILADRGIAACVNPDAWSAICRRMEESFRRARYEEGALAGVHEVTALLAAHFPADGANPDELPNRPVVL